MLTAFASFTASAAAMDISVKSAAYYDNGNVKSLNIDFGWDSADASSRLVVMTERLHSAGEEGTDGRYGDFTDLGHYGRKFKSLDELGWILLSRQPVYGNSGKERTAYIASL